MKTRPGIFRVRLFRETACFMILAAFAGTGLSAQESPGLIRATGRYYEAVSDQVSADLELLVKDLELRFNVYNKLFRFDPAAIHAPLRVRVFQDQVGYDAYVSSRLGNSREGAVYLHYPQSERRELVIHRGSPEEGRAFPHQAFIQFLRAFIPYPPTWMREGFAVYFSTLGFDGGSGELVYEENLAWLETVKALPDLPSPQTILLADIEGTFPRHFQALSWSLASFFLNGGNGGEDYLRILTDSFMVLSPSGTAAENARAVARRMEISGDMAALQRDYRTYLDSRRTFTELIEAGQKAYADQDAAAAELCFLNALNQKPTHYAPYYYLGLLAYEEKNYAGAEQYYRSALQYGADRALVYYALGLNSASAGRSAEAAGFLEEAAALAPERYRSRVENLLNRLRS
jgi:tetratricopeptide (TPR) repeat protein